jgi:hypothetical protein
VATPSTRARKDLKRVRQTLSRGDTDGAKVAADAFMRSIAALPEDSRESLLRGYRDELEHICHEGSASQLDTAILACRAAAAAVTSAAVTSDGSLRASILGDLSKVLTTRYNRVGVLADLDELVDVRCRAAGAAPASDPMRGERLLSASTGRLLRYEKLGTAADLDGMIDLGRSAEEAGLGQEASAQLFGNLCHGLRCRYELRGGLEDLTDAARYGQRAVQNAGPDDSFRAGYLVNYSNALLQRFILRGQEDDLQAGLTAARQAKECAAQPGLLTRALLVLATAMRLQSEQTGSPTDIQGAMTAAQQAIAAPADQAECLTNLALCLLGRFEAAAEVEDLNSAVEHGRQAAVIGAARNQARYLTNYFVLKKPPGA